MSANPTRVIDVRKQHVMSFRETWTLCLSGIKHRFFRSLLTLAVVVLAVAFFMFLLSESMFQRSVGRGVKAEADAYRAAGVRLTKMLSEATDIVLFRRLAEADEAARAEAARVTGLPPEEIDALAATAKEEAVYTDWIAALPTGHRLILFKRALGRDAFRAILADPAAFHDLLKPMIDVRVPGKVAGLDAFLAKFEDYAARMDVFGKLWNAKVADADAITLAAKGGRSADGEEVSDIAWVASCTDEAAEAWRLCLVKLGFEFTPTQLADMRQRFHDAEETVAVTEALSAPELRTRWMTEFHEGTRTVAEYKITQLGDPRAAKLLAPAFTAEELVGVRDRNAKEKRLELLEKRLSAVLRAEVVAFGLTTRQLFLLGISFLVCMVGIANAMLMSITERYREIATMKCLGATDAYILSQFMLEAALQGFFGGLLGVVIGLLIALVRSFALYGAHLATYFPASAIALSALASLAAGVLLAALASTQPSWAASRMAPMEAMRVE